MRALSSAVPAAILIAFAAGDGPAQEQATPLPPDERLHYSITWPSGLSVGKAELRARDLDPGWRLEMTLRASLPQIEIDDAFVARTDATLCSEEFEKHVRHGERRAHESLRFQDRELERTNLEAPYGEAPGRSVTDECARDALAYLYFLRRDLARGRIPPPGTVYFGAGYRVRLEFVRSRWLTVDAERLYVDEIRVVVRGPASRHTFSVFFGRDPARTPLLVRASFEEGPFSMKLVEEVPENAALPEKPELEAEGAAVVEGVVDLAEVG